MLLAISIDDSDALNYPLEFSNLGEASIRLTGEGLVLDGANTLSCTLSSSEGLVLASVAVAPPSTSSSSSEDDEWLVMPGARGHDRVSLAVDVPNFTICFDAAAATSSSRNTILRAVRLVRQKSMAAADETILSAPAADSSQQDTEDDILDASDLSDLPTVKKSVHGEWLRSANRPFQPVRCWLSSNPESVEALKRDASALVRTHGLGGRTFWMGVGEEPRCLLERFALEVLRFHSTAEDTFLGAEWWVQMRSCGGDADGSSIAFHFDCDEGIFSATGELVPPCYLQSPILVMVAHRHLYCLRCLMIRARRVVKGKGRI